MPVKQRGRALPGDRRRADSNADTDRQDDD
jgi:hypothetical protein